MKASSIVNRRDWVKNDYILLILLLMIVGLKDNKRLLCRIIKDIVRLTHCDVSLSFPKSKLRSL